MIIKNKFFLFRLLTISLILTYGIYFSISRSNALKKEALISEGIITSKYKIRSRGYYVNYEFYVNEKRYKGSKKLKKKDMNIVEGEKFVVEYAKINPDYSKIYLDKKVVDEKPRTEFKLHTRQKSIPAVL